MLAATKLTQTIIVKALQLFSVPVTHSTSRFVYSRPPTVDNQLNIAIIRVHSGTSGYRNFELIGCKRTNSGRLAGYYDNKRRWRIIFAPRTLCCGCYRLIVATLVAEGWLLCVLVSQRGRVGVPPERPEAGVGLPRPVWKLILSSLLLLVPGWSLIPNFAAPQGVRHVQLGARLVFGGGLLHHALQRPRRAALAQAPPPHQELHLPTVEGKCASWWRHSGIFVCGKNSSFWILFFFSTLQLLELK